MSFATRIKERIPACLPKEKLGGHWRNGDKGYDHICLYLEDNFLDQIVPSQCAIKGTKFCQPIHYHTDANSLNSSQVMCINFFKGFFFQPDYEDILLAVLRNSGLEIPTDVYIEDAIFEYVPNASENTNFDFFLFLSSGRQISFEIKYTEPNFGTISPDQINSTKYNQKWDTVYSNLVKKSAYLDYSTCDKNQFYSNYQINRNIVYANSGDITVFLTPKANHSLNTGCDYIDSFKNPNIKNVYWEELILALDPLICGNHELQAYFEKFRKKYLDIID